jgi:drug/metabolite transporter (DMT)-like permease
MIAIFASALLFGLVHPGSKFVMSQGISLLPFCILYVGIRLFAQFPIVISQRTWKVRAKAQWFYLVGLGLVGAALQVSEFGGVYDGLPIGVVSFLVYTHPIWTILLSKMINNEEISRVSLLRLSLAVAGITLITGFSAGFPWKLYILPIASGFLIALWISLSNKASKEGCSAGAISFYYDAFAFLVLLSLGYLKGNGSIHEALTFLRDPVNLGMISAYSILIGLLPNYLFYWGSRTSSTQAAGFTLLLEPLISTSVSGFIWSEAMSPAFIGGALLILSTNLPYEQLKTFFVRLKIFDRKRIAVSAGISVLVLFPRVALGNIYVIEVVPSDSSDYTVTKELEQIAAATDMALETYQRRVPSCKPRIEKIIRRGSEAELFTAVDGAARNKGAVIVGLSRTNFARLAAKAAAPHAATGLSIGASITNLRELNPNFGSIVSPWSRQWDALEKAMIKAGCNKSNTIGLFDPRSVLSQNFKGAYAARGEALDLVATLTPVDFAVRNIDRKCIFIGLNYSDGQKYLAKLVEQKWKGNIFGTGDWNYYSSEVSKTVNEAQYSGLFVSIPTGWTPDANERSKKFSNTMRKALGEVPSPISAYTYDAMLLALHSKCGNHDIFRWNAQVKSYLPLLREYEGVTSTGNFVSKMFLITKRSAANAR